MGTVGAATHAGGTVALGVLDDEGVDVETLGVGVGFGVLQQANDKLAALLRPATLGHLVRLALRVASDIALVAPVRDDLLLVDDSLEVSKGYGRRRSSLISTLSGKAEETHGYPHAKGACVPVCLRLCQLRDQDAAARSVKRVVAREKHLRDCATQVHATDGTDGSGRSSGLNTGSYSSGSFGQPGYVLLGALRDRLF